MLKHFQTWVKQKAQNKFLLPLIIFLAVFFSFYQFGLFSFQGVQDAWGYNYGYGNYDWVARTSAGSRSWLNIASSADGTKMAACTHNSYIYTSTDRGLTWTERTSAGSRYWDSIASSSDGNNLVAIAKDGYIYTSIDSGLTWVERISAGSRNWRDVSSSSDGTKIAAVVNGGYIYTSTDGGVTWTERTASGSRSWYGIASSSDGTKIAAVARSGYIYTSTDGGVTWTERTASGSRSWYGIASSSDGTKIAAVVNGGYIYTSTDGGVTWTERTSVGSRFWYDITSSSDGNKLAAINNDSYLDHGVYIHTSTDGGITWAGELLAGSRYWHGIASSSDGEKLAAAAYGNYIYINKIRLCGDGQVDSDEVCDGTNLNNQTCTSKGFTGGTLSCSNDCKSFNTSACTKPAVCGNGTIESGEDCDGTNLGGNGCLHMGKGYYSGTLQCTSQCKFDMSKCSTQMAECALLNPAYTSALYIYVGGQYRKFINEATFLNYGYKFNDVITINSLGSPIGANITSVESAVLAKCPAPGTCGNGNIDSGEVCDGVNFNGRSCKTEGYTGGTLACANDCKSFVTTSCINDSSKRPDFIVNDLGVKYFYTSDKDAAGRNYVSDNGNYYYAEIKNIGGDYEYQSWDSLSLNFEGQAGWLGASNDLSYFRKGIVAGNYIAGNVFKQNVTIILTGPSTNQAYNGTYNIKATVGYKDPYDRNVETNTTNNSLTKSIAIGSNSTADPVTCSTPLTSYNYLSGFDSSDTLQSLITNGYETKLNTLIDQTIAKFGNTEFKLPNLYKKLLGDCTWMRHNSTDNCYIYSYKAGKKVSEYTDQSCNDLISGKAKMLKAIKDGYCCSATAPVNKISTPVTCDKALNSYSYLTGFSDGDTLASIINNETKLNSLVKQVLANKAQISGLTGRRLTDTTQTPSTKESVVGLCKWLDHWTAIPQYWYIWSDKVNSKVSAYTDVTTVNLTEAEARMVKAIKEGYCCASTQTVKECSDGDAGKNYTVKSTVKYGAESVSDKCYDATRVIEYYCDSSGNMNSTKYQCSNGCIDGACVDEVYKPEEKKEEKSGPAKAMINPENNEVILRLTRRITDLEAQIKELAKLTKQINQALTNRLKGWLIIQPQGEAPFKGAVWFSHPKTGELFYVQNDKVAYDLFEAFAIGITPEDLEKIPLGYNAKANEGLVDTDGDKLPDFLEDAIGSDKTKTDTDADGYNDYDEYKNNFKLTGSGRYPINPAFANKLKGMYLNVKNGTIWYIDPINHTRNYVSPVNARKAMENYSRGVSNGDLGQLPLGEVEGE